MKPWPPSDLLHAAGSGITQPADPDSESKMLIPSLGIVEFLHGEYVSCSPFFSNSVRPDPSEHGPIHSVHIVQVCSSGKTQPVNP